MPARRTTLGTLTVLAAAATSGVAAAYPRPSAVPPRWEFEFEVGDLRLYADPADGERYWYFTYTVTNRTGRDRTWAPRFTLFTDAGEIVASGRNVPGRVTSDVLALLGNKLLETQNEVIGEIHHGREHAKEGLVIWPAGSVEVNELTIFVAGISGETATVTHPITGDRVVLHKTLQRDYLIPGEALPRGSRPIELIQEQWVMR
jgi:hypothetical protein